MADLVEFLRARLDDDLKVIDRDVQLGRWMWTEERLLAEVDVKRRIIDLHQPVDDGWEPDPIWCTECECNVEGRPSWPCDTLRLLAQPYAHHPDFDPEWKL